ncbi:proprotein convertase subtilisin/kexin type 5-like [Mercenaria mercenaria]|uniref:proprotein convertase subtilisin/kexin type 5-like n=1 Tax=Mercenaria mercenaria TaxID=6596 RepID=UPI00234F6C68|nr:proprotein convertase subtilisin/kexin type 5-like [Mercenaria mercenaria]
MLLKSVCVVLCCLCQTVQAIHRGCENCGCCIDGECNLPQPFPGYCNKGCVDGIYGDRCYNQCPSNCAACARNGQHINEVWTHDCTKCPDGKYLGTYRDCSLSCPSKCKTCTSGTVCTECKRPYFNFGAVTNCSLYCPTNCKSCSESGNCLACEDGYYSPESRCQNRCYSDCQSCSSLQTCERCKTGRYNGRELDIPTNVFYNDCRFSCRSSCEDCSSYNSCSSCVTWKYGSYCEKPAL